MSQFRSVSLAQKWAALHQERKKLMEGKMTEKVEDKIDLISSIMSSCKPGFLLPDAKIKKIIKFLKEHTGKKRVRYGALVDGEKPKTVLFKEIVVIYVEKDDQVFFREHIEEKK